MKVLGPGIAEQLAASSGRADEARLDRAADRAREEQTDMAALEQAAREFEGVFLNTLMKAMRETVPENELFNGGGATKFYRQMHDAEMAKALAGANGGLGIADLIVRQLDRPTGDAESPPAVGAPTPPAVRGPVGPEASRMVTLRRLARNHAPGAGDTLRRFEPEIHAAARGAGLDPALLLAVVMEESAGDPAALSPKGAEGLMQLMPGTAAEVGVEDRTDPAENLRGGANYLAGLIRSYDGDLPRALAAYNAGPGAVARAGGTIPDFPETRRYVRRVLDRYGDLSGGTHLAPGNR